MKKKIIPPTQKFLEIEEIREGTIILKNKNLRAVLLCTSINFELKSVKEQDALLYQYQGFLNSLDFPIQFLIKSRKLNIDSYLEKIKEIEEKQENELLKVQTQEYITFVKEFTELYNIMSKQFYVIIPYDVSMIKQQGFTDKLTGLFSKNKTPQAEGALSKDEFLRRKTQLWQRIGNVMAGLSAVGVKSVILNDDELYELFYETYNPTSKAPKIKY